MTVSTAKFKLEKHGINQVRFTVKIAFFPSLPSPPFSLSAYLQFWLWPYGS